MTQKKWKSNKNTNNSEQNEFQSPQLLCEEQEESIWIKLAIDFYLLNDISV